MMYMPYAKKVMNIGHDFELVQVPMGNTYANENEERRVLDFFPKFEINVELLFN